MQACCAGPRLSIDSGRIREACGTGGIATRARGLCGDCAMDDPDVLGAFLSGAGPSVAAIARVEAAPTVQRLLVAKYARAGVEATVRVLSVHDGASRAESEGSNRVADAPASARGRAV